MIKDKKEALEFCTKYGIELKKYNKILVTATGNIYLDTDNIDPKDLGEVFKVKGFGDEQKEVVTEVKETKKTSKKLKDGESFDNI